MEKRDLYDVNRKLTGEIIYKGQSIPKGKYISVVLSFIQNSNDKFLIQKRSVQKKGQYGSTGGHLKSGETSIQGMCTEIKEEIGIDISEKELELLFSGREDSSQLFFDIYYLKKDFNIDSLTLQEEEVESVEWYSIDEIHKLINDGLFLENHIEQFYRTIDILEERELCI